MPLSDNISFDENGIYIPQTWLDGTGEGNYTPITADRMNHIEQGIVGLSEAWDSQSLKLFRVVINASERLISGVNGSTVQPAGAEGTNVYDISDLGFEKPPFPLAIPLVNQNVLFKVTGGSASLRTDQLSISWHCLTPSYITPMIVLFEPA